MTTHEIPEQDTFHTRSLYSGLFTMGYTEQDAQQRLDTFLAQPSTKLIDIRYSPRSRWKPEFNQSALIKRYGPLKYEHCRALGNVNYNRASEPIKLLSPDEGVQHMIDLLLSGNSLMLLCACKAYEHCHRKTAYDLVMGALTLLNAGSDKTLESETNR